MSENNFSHLVENYRTICYNVMNASEKYHSDEKVQIMAVTKTVPVEAINKSIGLGIKLLGENRVQEFMSKRDSYDKSADVHFIGHLQTNKVKYIIDSVSMIQSVDSIRLAEEIDRQSQKSGKIMDILLEVNIGREISKDGVIPEELNELLYKVSELKSVKVKGLMAIPPVNCNESVFESMQKLYADIKNKKIDNVEMDILSMGMSADYELGIKYGSNLVRIGTKLFGARNYTEV